MNATARALLFGLVVTAGLTTALDNVIAAERAPMAAPAPATTRVIRLEPIVVTGHRDAV